MALYGESRADVVVIGAGAAGLMCAIEAGKRGRRVVVLEHNREIGRKILISGGGRCNFTNTHTRAENFLSRNRHFAKSALARYQPRDFIQLVERHRIRYHEKALGQLFCDGAAREIVAMLEAECTAAGVSIEAGCTVRSVAKVDDQFRIETSSATWLADSLVIATGGLSIPKLGATAFGYEIARQFGLQIVDCRPALVPLVFSAADRERFGELAGVATGIVASVDGHEFTERMLFTHRGLSGPAILQASSYWAPGDALRIDLLPSTDIVTLLRDARVAGDRTALRTILARVLPKRLADRWLEVHASEFDGGKFPASMGDKEIAALAAALHEWRVTPAGSEGYEKAEVTAGGVDTDEISSQTFEAKKSPGLYFIGEVLDVTGQLGGFSFQWAWASGYCAGQAV